MVDNDFFMGHITEFGSLCAIGDNDTDRYAIAWNDDGYVILCWEYRINKGYVMVSKTDTYHNWEQAVENFARMLVSI